MRKKIKSPEEWFEETMEVKEVKSYTFEGETVEIKIWGWKKGIKDKEVKEEEA